MMGLAQRRGAAAGLVSMVLVLGAPLPTVSAAGQAARAVVPAPGAECQAIAGPSNSFYVDDVNNISTVPSAPWPLSPPAAQGVNGTELDQAASHLDRQPELRSFLVIRHGKLIAEHYFHGATQRSSSNVHSASKTILAAAVGVAIRQGSIKSIDQSVATLLPDQFAGAFSGKKAITVRHLLTMTAGLRWTEDQTENQIETTSDWVRSIVARPLDHAPGSTFNYSTGLMHTMSAALTQASGVSTCDFVRRNLFDQMQISPTEWGRDPQGYFSGGCNLFLTAREMAEFGQLYLNHGIWKGKQLVPSAWVAAAMAPQADTGGGYWYGLGMWVSPMAGYRVSYAWGYGGQFIYMVPALDLVVVMTTDTMNYDIDFNGETVMTDLILPAVTPG